MPVETIYATIFVVAAFAVFGAALAFASYTSSK